ncbi:MAG TPA: glyoxalase [Planctomycetaceae bacterium]|nr:glyoxalase [Planctomycetaceae bacterium]
MPTVVHFEIPADDLARAKKFYQNLFDWKMEAYAGGDGEDEYLVVSTTDGEGKEGMGGGMMARHSPQQTTINYIGVPSLDEYVAKVESLGGRIIMEKTLVPGHGHFVHCLDTEGNAFGLWQCLPRQE